MTKREVQDIDLDVLCWLVSFVFTSRLQRKVPHSLQIAPSIAGLRMDKWLANRCRSRSDTLADMVGTSQVTLCTTTHFD